MNRLIIHKDLTQKTLFRVLGGSIYKNHYWDIARSKEEFIAYLTQFKPDIISIGPLEGLTPGQVAEYLRTFYKGIGCKLPNIISSRAEYSQQVKDALKA